MKQTYQAPSEETAGIRNLVLIYNGYYEQNRGNWMPEEFLPYLLYQRRDVYKRQGISFLQEPISRVFRKISGNLRSLTAQAMR